VTLKLSLASFQPMIPPPPSKVGGDADVVDADELHGVVDVIDEIFDRRGRVAGKLLIVPGNFSFVWRALLGVGIKLEEVKLMLKDNPAKLMWLNE
jgi:hypothetical protein